MEKTIFIPQITENDLKIPFGEVEDLIQDEGIIIVYNESKEIVGSVIYYDRVFYLGLKDAVCAYDSLCEILEECPLFIFKYIN